MTLASAPALSLSQCVMRIMAHPHPMKRTNFFSLPYASAERAEKKSLIKRARATVKKKDAKLNKVMMFLWDAGAGVDLI